MDDYFDALELRHGSVGRCDVLEVGLDDRFIRRQVQARHWTRIRPGAYCRSATWDTLDAYERHRRVARAVLRAHGEAVALSKVSGLLMRPGCEAWGVDLSRVHVVRRDGRTGSIETDVVHHKGPIRDDDLELVDGVLVMREADCVVETLAMTGVESGVCVGDAALHAGRVRPEDLERARSHRARWRGARRADLTLRLLDGRAESVGESRSRFVCWSQGLPKPEVQFRVYDVDGRLVGITDLAWPARRLLFEFDGRVKYGRLLRPGQEPGDAVFEEKRREDDLRRVTGFSMIRATWADLASPALLAQRTRTLMGPVSA